LNGNGDEDENGVESLDWWTKYHASVETTIKVRTAAHVYIAQRSNV